MEIDLTTETITRSVPAPTPNTLALTPDGQTLYVSTGTVSVISLAG